MKRIILSLILLIINFPIYIYAQTSPFSFKSHTEDSYSIVIGGATIDGVDLEFEDEIGVFTSSGLCVGAVVYSGSYPLGLAAWVDDSQTPEVDGYAVGEEMVFKIWDKSENKVIDAVASYITGNGTFGYGEYAVISTLTGIAKKAEILLGTTSLEFGDVIVNSMSSLNLVIENEGDKVLVITDIVSSSNLFTVSKSGFEIGINDNDIVEVVFKPLDAGSFSGSLTIYSNDYNNPDTVVSVSGNGIHPSQTIGLGQGWNWISFNVEPPDLSVENIFASTNNLEIVKNNEGQFYIPGSGWNGIGTIDITQGYIVYLSAANSVVVTGTQVDISTSISLASGWNLISYIPTFSLTPEEAFSSISTNLAICKNDDGNFYIPGVFNNMPSLTSGEAYQLYLSSSTEFVYPSVLSKQVYKNRISANSLNKFKGGHFTYRSKTGDFYPVLIEVKENQLEIGDEVGVFINNGNGNGEMCVGSAVFNGNSPLGISIWKDDAETDEIDGYREQDNITFKVWKTKENKEIPMPSTFSPGSNLIDPSLPYLMVSDLITVEEEDNYLITNYPNPFNPVTTIRFFLPNPAETTIEIYNVLGEKIKTIVNEYKLSGFYEVEWDAKNEYEENVASGVYLCRLKQGRNVLVKKLTVLR